MAKWTIYKGWHTSLSNFWLRIIPKCKTGPVSYKFKMSGDNWYPYADIDDLDINKFFGFSLGKHHDNSVRVGWTPDFNQKGNFTIYFYLYNNKVRTMSRFTEIKADTSYSIKISLDHGFVTFELFDITGLSIAKASEKFVQPAQKIGYYLWFFFGGNKPAPKKMVSWIKRLRK